MTYPHNCPVCRLLGEPFTYDAPLVEGTERTTVDLYYCAETELGGTILARYGNGGCEYASTAIDILKNFVEDQNLLRATHGPALREGYRRWQALQSP